MNFSSLVREILNFFISVYFYISISLIFFGAYLKLLLGKYSWQEYIDYSKKVLDLVKKISKKIYIEGERNLKEVSPPLIIISNHMSSLETLIFGYILGRYFRISFVVKDSLLKYPVIGRLIKFLNPIAVGRKNARDDFEIILKKAKNLIDKKISIVVFPQGRRSKLIDRKNFNKIGIKLSKAFNIDLLPICVKTDFLEIGKLIRDIGKINPQNALHIRIFTPIKSSNLDRTTHDYIIDLFKNTLNNWMQHIILYFLLNSFIIYYI
ncbi:MAG: 1-acyl-sn-glycerol-3-phosphate acyltransferase [Endomicrobia bacterium]|nr:1-acyl-sn-glycerol-3-phosphate acyltransferase [Endomicrobiia bacterium]